MISVKATERDLRRRLLVHQRAAEHAFQRPHQPALDPVGILPNAAAAEIGAVVLVVEEDGAGQRDLVLFQRHQPRLAVLDDADGRIGTPKSMPP